MPKITLLRDKHITKTKYKDRRYSRYYSMYRPYRDSYYTLHPLDELMLLEDKVVSATDIHHAVEFIKGRTEQERIDLLLDMDNFISLSELMHYIVHRSPDKLTTRQRLYLLAKKNMIRSKYGL